MKIEPKRAIQSDKGSNNNNNKNSPITKYYKK